MRHLSRSLLAMAVIGLSLSGVSSITQAEPLNYHLVELSAEAKRTISNDLLQATLYVEDSHGQAAELAQRLNRVADEALKKAKRYPAVKISSQGQNTWPIYDKRKISGWRGRVEFRLEATEHDQAAALIADLEGQLQIAQLGFSISDSARRKVEQQLTPEALKAFEERAQLVARNLGNGKYRIVNLTVLNQGQFYAHRPVRAMSMAAKVADEAAVMPTFAAGDSEVGVQVQGRIQYEP